MELNFYFIWPLHTTTMFKISKLICCLAHIIHTICCFFKTTHKTKSNTLTYTRISGCDIKASRIYWNNKTNAWHPVSVRTYVHVNFAPNRVVFAIFAVFSHDIARCHNILIHIQWLSENYFFNCPLNMSVALLMMTS
jgi:hypothetical protein